MNAARTPVPAEFASNGYDTPGASDAQIKFIRSLIEERAIAEEARALLIAKIDRQSVANLERGDCAPEENGISKRAASDAIGKLLDHPRKQTRTQWADAFKDLPDVPEGRYAIEDAQDGVLHFYKVDRPTEGRWAGRTFVKAGKGGPHGEPEWIQLKKPITIKAVLDAINRNPKEASRRYGLELGHCGICGRTLTDAESRAYGIGPVCRGKSGW